VTLQKQIEFDETNYPGTSNIPEVYPETPEKPVVIYSLLCGLRRPEK
jgi:hypothetical protein